MAVTGSNAFAAKRPIAVQWLGELLATACRDSGSICLVDVDSKQMVCEQPIAGNLSDMAVISDEWVAVCDSEASHLQLLDYDGHEFSKQQQIDLPLKPIRIKASPKKNLLAVSLLWANQIALFEMKRSDASIRLVDKVLIDLDFAPRELQFLPNARLLVADAYGSEIAIVNVKEQCVERSFRIPGHNIRGVSLTFDQKGILLTHQQANEFVPGTRNHVFWGNVVTNLLRRIPLGQIDRLQSNGQTLHGFLFPLADQDQGSGDPSAILVSKTGKQIVALSGVNEMAVRLKRANSIKRFKTGRRPIALYEHVRRETIVVANQFDDSLSVVDLEKETVDTIPLGNREEVDPHDGEALFYDATLSLDGWVSCSSCHPDGHTNGKLNDNLGDDGYGDPKRVISLLGTGDTAPWAWNGSQNNLVDQVRKSLYLTMHGAQEATILEEDVMSITSFLRTLKHPPSVKSARGNIDPHQFKAGERVFQEQACADCHNGSAYTSREISSQRFLNDPQTHVLNAPSLRGVSQRIRWLHDGRAQSLRDVFERHGHQDANDLPSKELDALLYFLNCL